MALKADTWKPSIPGYGVGFLLCWKGGFHRRGKHSGLLRATGKAGGVSVPFCGTVSSTPWGSKFPQPQQLSPARAFFPGVVLSPLQIPFPSTHCPFPCTRGTYLASWMRTMMVHRPISPHTLAVPISAKTSTHSSTLSQVSSFCCGSDCKTQRGGGGQDAGSVWELNRAEAQPSLVGPSEISTGWPWKSQPQNQKVVPPLRPKSTQKPTSLPPSRGRPRHHSITQSCYPRNRENMTAVSWIAFYPK